MRAVGGYYCAVQMPFIPQQFVKRANVHKRALFLEDALYKRLCEVSGRFLDTALSLPPRPRRRFSKRLEHIRGAIKMRRVGHSIDMSLRGVGLQVSMQHVFEVTNYLIKNKSWCSSVCVYGESERKPEREIERE